jgi:hypothetical protein
MPDHNQTAPGELEIVRRFLNTWSIPNDTRQAFDQLPDLIHSPRLWQQEFGKHLLTETDTLDELCLLRTDLRRASMPSGEHALNKWFSRVTLGVRAGKVGDDTKLIIEPGVTSFVGYVVSLVANAIASSEWSRLKTCPDCQWAFYDHTRNGGKRWCGMTKGGVNGRACGTIAKVAAYRARAAKQAGVS